MTIKIAPAFSSLRIILVLLSLPLALAFLFRDMEADFLLICVLFIVLFSLSLWFAMTVRITLENGHIHIRYLNYQYYDSLDNFYPEASSKFSYRQDKQLGLKHMLSGTNLKGFKVGWCELKNEAPGFICLTRRKNARALAAKDGTYLLLDPSVAEQVENCINTD